MDHSFIVSPWSRSFCNIIFILGRIDRGYSVHVGVPYISILVMTCNGLDELNTIRHSKICLMAKINALTVSTIER